MLFIELERSLRQGIRYGGLPELIDKPAMTAKAEQGPLILFFFFTISKLALVITGHSSA